MSWFYLALLAPLLYAIVNLFDDSLLRFVYKSPYLATVFAGFFGALPLIALLFKPTEIALNLALLSVLSGFLTVSYYYYYFRGLESDSPSVVIALFSLAPATIPIFAHFIVHEKLNSMEVAGFLVILLASLSLAAVDIKKLKFSKALLPVVIAVVFMDAVSIITKYVYQNTSFFSAYMYFCMGMGLGGIYFLFWKFSDNKKNLLDVKKILKKVMPVFILAEMLNLGAEFTLNLAISRGPVSLVKVIEGIQPMFVLLIAVALYPFAPRFFREAESGGLLKKFALMAVAIVGLGIVAIAGGTEKL